MLDVFTVFLIVILCVINTKKMYLFFLLFLFVFIYRCILIPDLILYYYRRIPLILLLLHLKDFIWPL